MEESIRLNEIKQAIEDKLAEEGFQLEFFSVEVIDDGNHLAHIVVEILPETLKDPTERKVDEMFEDIMEGLL